MEKFDADHAQQVPKPPAPKPGVPPGDLPPVPDPAPPPIENPGDAPLSPITDPDVIEPGEPNPARTPMLDGCHCHHCDAAVGDKSDRGPKEESLSWPRWATGGVSNDVWEGEI